MIRAKNSLKGNLNNAIIHEYPELENLLVTPSGMKQVFKHEGSYGYDEVVVDAIPSNHGAKYKPNYISFINFLGTNLDYELNNLDTSSITNFSQMFAYCFNLTSISQLDTSNGIEFANTFEECNSLTSIPQLDLRNSTNFISMFQGCTSLRTISLLNTGNGKSFSSTFYNCFNLTSIPQLDTSNATNFAQMFRYCSNLTTIPELNTSKGTNFSNMFNGCSKLTSIPQLDTSNATNLNSTFYGCSVITALPQLEAGSVTNCQNVVQNCSKLVDLGGFMDLGKAYSTTSAANYLPYKLTLSGSSRLTHDSLMNVINNLYDIKTKGCNNQSLVLGATNLAKLTADEIAIATNKGWTVS